MKIDKNQPAFPYEGTGHPDTVGLTKREYFAAMVISGKDGNPEHIAEHAIMVADELIKLLNNGASGE